MPQTVEFRLGGTLIFQSEETARGYALVTLRYGSFSVTARGDGMAYTLAVGMQVHVQISYVDAAGNPATVDGDVTWSSSNPETLDIQVDSADSTKATLRAVGTAGQVQVSALADADLGEGSREITTLMDVDVVPGEAVAGTIAPVGGAEPIPHVEHH